MGVEELLRDGFEKLRGNPYLLALPFLRYLSWLLLAGIYALLVVAASFTLLLQKFVALVLFISLSLLGLIAFLAVNSFFTAAVAGMANDVLYGGKASLASAAGWGKRRWYHVFRVSVALKAAYASLLLLFAPAAALLLLGQALPSMFLFLVATSAAYTLLLVSAILFLPLNYLAVLEEMGFTAYYRASAKYVKENLAAVLIVFSATMTASAVLYASASVFTGPITTFLNLIPDVGPAFAVFAAIPFNAVVMALVEAQSTVWWMGLLKERKPVQTV